MWRTTYLHGPAVLRRICRRGRVPRNMTPSGRKWMPGLPAIRARTLLRQKPSPESLVCPSKRPPSQPVIFLPSRTPRSRSRPIRSCRITGDLSTIKTAATSTRLRPPSCPASSCQRARGLDGKPLLHVSTVVVPRHISSAILGTPDRREALLPFGGFNARNCDTDRWLRTRLRCSRVAFPPKAPSGETAIWRLTGRSVSNLADIANCVDALAGRRFRRNGIG